METPKSYPHSILYSLMTSCIMKGMARKKNKGWVKGTNVTVSPKAHEVMLKEANSVRPRKSLRQIINIKNNLPEEL